MTQLKVLNPMLITEGIGLSAHEIAGRLVPVSPDEEEEEE